MNLTISGVLRYYLRVDIDICPFSRFVLLVLTFWVGVQVKLNTRNLDILRPLIYSYWQMKYGSEIIHVLDWQSSLFWGDKVVNI